MIELSHVSKSYKMGDVTITALRDVSLRIEEGEFVAIIGQSGSGKSTMMHLIGLLDVPESGELRLFGQNVAKMDPDELAALRSQSIGFIFQQFHLLARTTARDNVALPLIYHHSSGDTADPSALLKRVGLGARIDHKPNELSGGQQQRVAIARALVNKPRLLLADEPTGNLDTKNGEEILSLLKELNREGITVVLVTHEPDIAAQASRVIRLQDGKVVSDENRGQPAALVSSARSRQSPHQAGWQWREAWMHVKEARRALAANKMRTFLSTLGIFIGVASVVAMIALGEGAQRSISRELSGLGSNRLTLRTNAQSSGAVRLQAGQLSRITADNVEDIKAAVPDARYVAPMVRSRVQAAFGGQNANTEVVGSTVDYMGVYSAVPIAGRAFTREENESRARVALLGQTVVSALFGKRSPVGETIRINKVLFNVIGVLPARGASGPRDDDDVILVPINTAMRRLFGKNFYDSVDIAASSGETVNATQRAIEAEARKWPSLPNVVGDSYRVDNLASVQAAFTSIARMLGILLAAIAGVSLVVGGIGIMNIMLVSVTERTREIGLRKALGARRREILGQFLVESVAVSLLGGLAGIGLGWVAVKALSVASGWAMSVSFWAVFLACAFSGGIGVGFGLWPARRAAELNPIEALRSE